MALEDAVGNFPALLLESYFTRGAYVDETIALQTADGHGDSGCGYFEPTGEGCGDDRLAFPFGLGDGLQVILFRDGDSHALPNCSMPYVPEIAPTSCSSFLRNNAESEPGFRSMTPAVTWTVTVCDRPISCTGEPHVSKSGAAVE